jgi:hypothetical protein
MRVNLDGSGRHSSQNEKLRSHRELLLNGFRAKESTALGAVEVLNNKAKVTTKKAGFK